MPTHKQPQYLYMKLWLMMLLSHYNKFPGEVVLTKTSVPLNSTKYCKTYYNCIKLCTFLSSHWQTCWLWFQLRKLQITGFSPSLSVHTPDGIGPKQQLWPQGHRSKWSEHCIDSLKLQTWETGVSYLFIVFLWDINHFYIYSSAQHLVLWLSYCLECTIEIYIDRFIDRFCAGAIIAFQLSFLAT